MEILDINGIKSIKLGEQIWMLENLKVESFRNGDPIKKIQERKDWDYNNKVKAPAYCVPDKADGFEVGLLYNGFALSDERELAPEGWRLPGMNDIQELRVFLEEAGCENLSALCSNEVVWDTSNAPDVKYAFNELGFNLLPVTSRLNVGFGGELRRRDAVLGLKPNKVYNVIQYQKLNIYPSNGIGKLNANSMDKGEGVAVRCIKCKD